MANPIANLISIPIQANYDENIGPTDDGSTWRINIQPVIPFSLNDEWDVITRTILPIISQEDGVEGVRDGLGWTIASTEDSGDFILTASGHDVAFVVFGACTIHR